MLQLKEIPAALKSGLDLNRSLSYKETQLAGVEEAWRLSVSQAGHRASRAPLRRSPPPWAAGERQQASEAWAAAGLTSEPPAATSPAPRSPARRPPPQTSARTAPARRDWLAPASSPAVGGWGEARGRPPRPRRGAAAAARCSSPLAAGAVALLPPRPVRQ